MGIVLQQLPLNDYKRLKQWWTSMIGSTRVRLKQHRLEHLEGKMLKVFDNKKMNVPQLVFLIK